MGFGVDIKVWLSTMKSVVRDAALTIFFLEIVIVSSQFSILHRITVAQYSTVCVAKSPVSSTSLSINAMKIRLDL